MSNMADDRTEGVIVHLVDKHGGGEIECEYDDWEDRRRGMDSVHRLVTRRRT